MTNHPLHAARDHGEPDHSKKREQQKGKTKYAYCRNTDISNAQGVFRKPLQSLFQRAALADFLQILHAKQSERADYEDGKYRKVHKSTKCFDVSFCLWA